MRIIGGEHKRKTLRGPGPKDMTIRPTYDRVKESIFNLLGPLDGLEIIDLFAGTGSVGIEAISRGAKKAVFVDSSKVSIEIIKENIEKIDIADRAEVIRSDVLDFLKRARSPITADVIFIDPPYKSDFFESAMKILGERGRLTEKTIVVGQHGWKPESEIFGVLHQYDVRKYGKTHITLWETEQERI